MVELRAKLETVAGLSMDDEAIRRAIQTMNRGRQQLLALQRLRHEEPAMIGGSDALRIIGSASFADKESHAALLDAVVSNRASLAPQYGPRLMVKGSTLDNTALYEFVESFGAVVVASDHPWGDGTFEHQVAESGDPIEALTEHYHLHSASDRQYPQSISDARFMDLVRSARVQGVIFYLDDWDDTLGWDYPAQKQALDRLGIPSVLLKQQPYWHKDVHGQSEVIREFVKTVSEQSATPMELPA
jgi:benzoyl-CoA reductase/2-hydroxyglutaryl-CoA dehydratase subunit BcrC/BadD/HgdB